MKSLLKILLFFTVILKVGEVKSTTVMRVGYQYNSSGLLTALRNADNNALLWQANGINALGQITESTLGNNLKRITGYDTYHLPNQIQLKDGVSVIDQIDYNFNPVTGNVTSRNDVTNSRNELFGYDVLHRLDTIRLNSGIQNRTTYYPNGNINTKFDVGTYQYANNSHAVSGISNPVSGYNPPAFTLSSTSYNRPALLTQQGNPTKKIEFQYNADDQRSKTLYYENNVLAKTMYYVGGYEKEVIEGGDTNEYDYIYSPEGLSAIALKTGGIRTLYYIHIDHLGSLRVVTTQAKAIQSRYYYDAWGARTLVAGTTITNRGFTGHEHLPEFGFINMNARLYDPVLGRFLAMDPFVQMPDYTQAFNRYTYAMNNPLIYVDENGEFWHIIIGALVGGVINWVSNGCQFTWEGLSYFGVGAAAGALTALAPNAYALISAGASAANSTLQQGFASDWQKINSGKIIFDGIIGGATAYASGGLGKMLSPHISKLVGGISSPLLRETLASQIVGVPLGGLFGGLGALGDQNPETSFWDAFGKGAMMGLFTSTISGLGNAVQYSVDNKVGLVTGEKRHGHHSDPIFMGGDQKQKLTEMNASKHQQLHKDLSDYLYQQQDANGKHMRPQSNNSGSDIQRNFSPQQRQDAMKSFYDANKWKYPGARYDYYRNTGLRWWIW